MRQSMWQQHVFNPFLMITALRQMSRTLRFMAYALPALNKE